MHLFYGRNDMNAPKLSCSIPHLGTDKKQEDYLTYMERGGKTLSNILL